jgi:hypothetical protein
MKADIRGSFASGIVSSISDADCLSVTVSAGSVMEFHVIGQIGKMLLCR